MLTTGKYSQKMYKCRSCGTEQLNGTNHWGSIYPYCHTCRTVTIWDCLESMPDGYTKPEEWKIAKLGDICTIK